jgi:hypothetical protein
LTESRAERCCAAPPPTLDSNTGMIVALRASLEAVFDRLDLLRGSVPLFERHRRHLTDRRVPTLRVVPALDELEHDRHGLTLTAKLVLHQQFALDRGEERLAHRVVVAVADRADRWPHALGTTTSTELDRCIRSRSLTPVLTCVAQASTTMLCSRA